MPVVTDFPKDTNPQAFEAGLILQSKTEIETNTAGLEQATLSFICLNRYRRRFTPGRGTPVGEFPAGDRRTRDILRALDELGAQSCGFTRNGHSPGKGLLKVLCQGAIFADDEEITSPYQSFDYTPQTLSPVRLYDGDNTLLSNAILDYDSIDLTWEYVARNKPTGPRFLIDPYEVDAENAAPPITHVEGSTASEDNPVPLMFRILAADETGVAPNIDYRPWLRIRMKAGRLSVRQAGQFWSVTETNQVIYEAVVPDLS